MLIVAHTYVRSNYLKVRILIPGAAKLLGNNQQSFISGFRIRSCPLTNHDADVLIAQRIESLRFVS